MTLQQLRYFSVLAGTQNMRQAAEQLYISQPSLSVSLQKLEEELGVALFERTGHHIRLTDAGREFLTHCERILQETDNSLLHMKRLSEAHQKKISVGCISPVLRGYLPKKMNAFLSRPENKGIEFEIEEGTTPELIEKLKNGVLDFLICSGIPDDRLDCTLLKRTPLVLVRPAAESEKHSKNYTWDEIAVIPMLGYPTGAAMNGILSDMWLDHGIYPAYRYRMPHEEAILAMVECGFGFAVIPETDNIGNFNVDICPLPSGNYARNICITSLKGQKLTGASLLFTEFLKEV